MSNKKLYSEIINAKKLRKEAKTRLEKDESLNMKASCSNINDCKQLINELRIHEIELEMQNEALQSSQKNLEVLVHQYKELYEKAPVSYITLADNAIITQLNEATENLLGYSRSQIIGNLLGAYVSPPDLPLYNNFIKVIEKSEKNVQIELQFLSKNKQFLSLQADGVRIKNGHEILVALTDVTKQKCSQIELKKNQKKLEQMANYDSLTNLPNRVLLYDRLAHVINACERNQKYAALAFIDIDGFKVINDTYSHKLGDKLLIAFTKRLEGLMRKGDTLSRIGGDEFAILFCNLDIVPQLLPMLDRFLSASLKPFPIEYNIFNISISIGITVYPQDKSTPEILLHHADQAMYLAKQAGKNRYIFYDL